MKKPKKLIQESFLSALGVFVYISAISLLFKYGDKLFGAKPDQYWGPVIFLLLFIISALITGFLVLGRPIWFYLGGRKEAAVRLLLYTVGWLAGLLMVIIVVKIAIG